MAILSVVSSSPIPGERRHALRSTLCCLGVFLIFGFHFVSLFIYQSRLRGDRLHDFPTFYAAAKLALSQGDIYTAGATPDVRYVYPPLIAVVFTPLTWFSLRNAAHLFLLLNVAIMLGAICLATKSTLSRLKLDKDAVFWPAVLLCTLLSIVQTRNVLVMGETDVLMLFLFVLAFYWVDSAPLLAGLAIGFAFNVKYLSVVAVPYLLLRRRWAAVFYSVAGSVFFSAGPGAASWMA